MLKTSQVKKSSPSILNVAVMSPFISGVEVLLERLISSPLTRSPALNPIRYEVG